MEPLSIASFTLASILSSLPANGEQPSQSVITTHISPAIAGQWEIDLDSANKLSTAAPQSIDAAIVSKEPKVIAGQEDGVLDQSERRIVQIKPNSVSSSNTVADSSTITLTSANAENPNQCRELYNFAADNEMWAVSGKEWTYGRYLVSYREEGLPIIAIKTIYDNNEVDCSGNKVDQTDEALVAFLQHDGNQMQWCADPDGKECFMNFHRVLP